MRDDQAVSFIRLHFVNGRPDSWLMLDRNRIICLTNNEFLDQGTRIYCEANQIFVVKESPAEIFQKIADAIAADVDGVTHETD